MPKTVVLLDFDGTIADTDPVIYESMNILYDKYRDGNRATLEEMIQFSGPPIADTLKKEFPNIDQEMLYNEFIKLSFELYPSKMIPYPHLEETLITLKQKGYKVGVVSSKTHDGLTRVLDILNITKYMDTYVGLDDVEHGKPYPDGILKAMDILGEVDKSKVIYIGDNDTDIIACDRAGVDSVIVRYTPRYNPMWKPTYTIGDLKEILEAINHD